MSQTNRALNRILLALAGLAPLAAGASTAGILPDIAALWAAAGSSLADRAGSLLAAAPLPGPARNWRPVAGVAAPVLTAALGIAWLASQGGGRTSRVARETDGGLGTTVVETGLVSAAGKHALDGRPPGPRHHGLGLGNPGQNQTSAATTGTAGSFPREIADTADQLVRGIEALLGHPLPVLVRITSGTRTRVAGPGRPR